jgi:mutator protein MutT
MRIRVAAGLIVQDGRYLISRRKAAAHLGGLWEFPGGKVEPDELLENCLRRELREELGIEIADPVRFQVIRHDYPDKSVELHFFFCSIKSGQAQALACDEIRWVTPEEMTDLAFPAADRSLIEALQNLHR